MLACDEASLNRTAACLTRVLCELVDVCRDSKSIDNYGRAYRPPSARRACRSRVVDFSNTPDVPTNVDEHRSRRGRDTATLLAHVTDRPCRGRSRTIIGDNEGHRPLGAYSSDDREIMQRFARRRKLVFLPLSISHPLNDDSSIRFRSE